ncbi:hypothetical protein Tco_0628387 [Tanacetum coccineum]|uniref:Uncharacterized protein n=1 Tax=Tanacetum coccineum TaxID=301880 RepID=A0ABQ4WQ63_9ASTR
MKQDKAQQVARDENLVPTEDRVKIRSSNLKIDPTLTQKEETYQVVLDIIKDISCYNAFLITADVPEIYMQQLWFTIIKVKKSSFYQFDLDNKKCQIDVELFREILGMYHKENVDYAALIWEDFQYQINNRKSKVRRRDSMPYPRLKLISKGEEHQVYGKPILDILVTNDIQNSEAYKTFISISTCLIHLKKGKGKGAQGTKETVTPKKATTAPKKTLPKKKESKKKVSKKQSSITADDNILQDPDEALKLGKSVSQTETEITKEHRRVHETHEQGNLEELPSETLHVFQRRNQSISLKLKGIGLLSDASHLGINTQKAIKASKRESRFQHQSGGSSERAGITPEVSDEPTRKSTVLDEGAGTSPEVSDETKDKNIPWVSTDEDETDDDNEDEDDDKGIDIEKTADEKTDDEELKADKEQQGDDQAGDEQVGVLVSTTHKEKSNLLQSTSSHSVSSNFGNQFLNNSPNVSLISTIQENDKAEIN